MRASKLYEVLSVQFISLTWFSVIIILGKIDLFSEKKLGAQRNEDWIFSYFISHRFLVLFCNCLFSDLWNTFKFSLNKHDSFIRATEREVMLSTRMLPVGHTFPSWRQTSFSPSSSWLAAGPRPCPPWPPWRPRWPTWWRGWRGWRRSWRPRTRGLLLWRLVLIPEVGSFLPQKY